ncbi:hypothetical protein VP01_2274g1 [Puccinia sorghi]|uniref:Uncharacterized protein n=1 Tax=Puccinia sorghi TaxID=27349 RepID=A0A0L6V8D6_9BASI|nr:hypothetical protein VP01_2274g1 [Puccinia sorghi]
MSDLRIKDELFIPLGVRVPKIAWEEWKEGILIVKEGERKFGKRGLDPQILVWGWGCHNPAQEKKQKKEVITEFKRENEQGSDEILQERIYRYQFLFCFFEALAISILLELIREGLIIMSFIFHTTNGGKAWKKEYSLLDHLWETFIQIFNRWFSWFQLNLPLLYKKGRNFNTISFILYLMEFIYTYSFGGTSRIFKTSRSRLSSNFKKELLPSRQYMPVQIPSQSNPCLKLFLTFSTRISIQFDCLFFSILFTMLVGYEKPLFLPFVFFLRLLLPSTLCSLFIPRHLTLTFQLFHLTLWYDFFFFFFFFPSSSKLSKIMANSYPKRKTPSPHWHFLWNTRSSEFLCICHHLDLAKTAGTISPRVSHQNQLLVMRKLHHSHDNIH